MEWALLFALAVLCPPWVGVVILTLFCLEMLIRVLCWLVL